MTLIESIVVDSNLISFYDGIDIDLVINHPKDGSKGFIFCFIDNWSKEVKSWKRQTKIDSILMNKRHLEFEIEDLNNNYTIIYQLDEVKLEVLFKIIKDKVINKNFTEHPYITFDKKIPKLKNHS